MSEAIVFDTHSFVKNLTASGFTEKQAEALANEQVQLLNANLATKSDILGVKGELEAKLESVKGGLEVKLENVKGDLEVKLEKLKGDLEVKLKTLKGDLEVKIENVKGELLKWMVMAMIAQGGLIVALVKAL